MAVIVLRSVKGSPLTIAEADANFSNLNTEVGAKLDAATYTAADILTKIKTVDGTASGLDADLLDGLNASNAHIPSTATIVARDTFGNFSANTITANLVGNVTGNVTGTLTGTFVGNATNVDGVVAVTNGGTGGSTALSARTNLGLGTISTQNSNSVSITGGAISGITDLTIADGGTGASTALQARTNLGLVIGSDVQPFSNELTSIAAAVNATGFYARIGDGSVNQRTITVGGNGLSITNGNGVSGNPVISIPTNSTMQLDALSSRTLSVSAELTAGSITATGNITAFFSDDRLKTKLGKIENALDKICSLEGFYFEPNQTAQDLGYTAEKQVGVSAQSVQAVLPEVVHPAPIDPKYLTVDYSKIVPLIIEAIKELREEIKSIK